MKATIKCSFIPTIILMNDIRKLFGKNIKKLRTRKWWTQEELSGYSGLHRNHISMIEIGKKNVTIDSIKKLADAFRVVAKELFDISK